MNRGRRPPRSSIALLIAAIVLGVFTLAPVSAHFSQNTKHLGKHAWKQLIRKKADRRYVRDREVLGAVVNNAGQFHGAELVRGQGVTDVTGGSGATEITFRRRVTGCVYTASYDAGALDTGFAIVQAHPTNPRKIAVRLKDEDGSSISGSGERFHLIVFCP